MNHKQASDSPIQLGRGQPFSRAALEALWRVVISNNPADDWSKGRLLSLVLTAAVLIWALGGLVNVVLPSLGGGSNRLGQTIDGATDRTDAETQIDGRVPTKEQLRDDLFKVPRPQQDKTRKAPKTNPVELLGLIELQGVLGGANPRAIVLYKSTQKTVTVSVGDDLGEFKVEEIRERSVILKWRNELFELLL